MANTSPIFVGLAVFLRSRSTNALVARDGTAGATSVVPLVREDGSTFQGARAYYSCTADAGTDRLTVTIPDITYSKADNPLPFREGSVFEFVSGTPPTGTSNNVKYQVVNLIIVSTTSVSFQVLSRSTFAVLDLSSTGTTPVIGFDVGTRIDRITWVATGTVTSALSAMVVRAYVSDSAGANWRLRAEVNFSSITPLNTLAGQTQQTQFTGGIVVPSGCQLGVTQSIFASAATDQIDVFAEGGDFIAI